MTQLGCGACIAAVEMMCNNADERPKYTFAVIAIWTKRAHNFYIYYHSGRCEHFPLRAANKTAMHHERMCHEQL